MVDEGGEEELGMLPSVSRLITDPKSAGIVGSFREFGGFVSI